MKIRHLQIVGGLLLATTVWGQTPRPVAAPNPAEDIPDFAPVEFSDGSVTFNVYAPNAKSVEVRGEAAEVAGRRFLPMTRDDRGVWTASLSGLRPDGYTYSYSTT